MQAPRKDANGFLRVDGRLSRTGVMLYPQPDGRVRRELVPPDELFRKDSLATLQLIPVTDQHPPEMLTPENARRFQAGAVGSEPRRDDDGQISYLVASYLLTDPTLIKRVDARERVELSPGYYCDLDETPGVWVDGERYDAIQRNRIYNHVAVVPVGRCTGNCGGSACSCRLHLDEGADMSKTVKVKHRDGQMVTVPIESLEKLVSNLKPPEQAEFWREIAMRGSDDGDDGADDAPDLGGPPPPPGVPTMAGVGAPAPRPVPPPVVRADDADKRKDAEIEALRSRLALAEKARREDAAKVRSEIERSLAIRSYAGRVMPSGWSDAGKDDDAVRRDVLKHVHADRRPERFDAMPSHDLDIWLDGAMEHFPGTNLGDVSRIDSAPNKLEEARAKYYARMSGANGVAGK